MENGVETEEGFIIVHRPPPEIFTQPNTSDVPKRSIELVLRAKEISFNQNIGIQSEFS